jgi:PIN domain nuclease of toxin-antitoxin system
VTALLDAFALVALLRDEPAADEVEALIRRGGTAMSAINLAEALDVLQRIAGISRERLDELTVPLVDDAITVVPVDEGIGREAADVRTRRYHRSRSPLSLADCALLATARGADPAVPVVTADPPLAAAARDEGLEVTALPNSGGRRP